MKHEKEFSEIIGRLSEVGVVVDSVREKQLRLYYQLLWVWNKKINLVSRIRTDEAIKKNIYSSFLFWSVLNESSPPPGFCFADLGSGGGFPGVVLSIMQPGNKGVLVDSSRKKTLFLKKVVSELSLNATVLVKRVEALSLPEENKYQVITALAFAPLDKLLGYAAPLLKKNGFVLTLKGKSYAEELVETGVERYKITPVKIDNSWCRLVPGYENKTMLRLEL